MGLNKPFMRNVNLKCKNVHEDKKQQLLTTTIDADLLFVSSSDVFTKN